MSFSRIPLLLALTHIVFAEQPDAPSPIAAPLRELPWGQLNFLHTTDTHGWHGGHLQEAQYAADWGDYISFAHHLRKRADEDGSDLLLVDTGDRVEGNGLYDASNPKGKYTLDIIKEQQMDVITVGNHELYLRNTSIREYEEMVPDFKDAYIASNLDVYDPKDGKLVPLARRYRKFTTKNQRIRITAFGFLFNFKGNANNTVVQPVEETIKEQWFQDAIRDRDVDLFLVAGHVPVRDSGEFDHVYKAIRDVQWDTPIVFFGGHTHIRDFRKWEKKAQGIESGRYMETLGFLSMSDVSKGKGISNDAIETTTVASPQYQRLYIDNNLYSMHYHSKTNVSTFDTELGANVSKAIYEARQRLKLDYTYGCAPRDLWLNRAPYPSNDSLLTWLEDEVLPQAFNDTTKAIVITNSGAMRFDVFKGPFTIDTTFLVSPFTSGFRSIKNVPYKIASKVLPLLNNEGPISVNDLVTLVGSEQVGYEYNLDALIPARPPVNPQSLANSEVRLNEHSLTGQIPLTNFEDAPRVPGYTTKDDLGKDGDDTIHQPIQFYNVPNCVAADVGFSDTASSGNANDTPENVDLVYNEFIESWVLLALRFLGVSYGKENTREALDGKTMTDIISSWVADNWNCDE